MELRISDYQTIVAVYGKEWSWIASFRFAGWVTSRGFVWYEKPRKPDGRPSDRRRDSPRRISRYGVSTLTGKQDSRSIFPLYLRLTLDVASFCSEKSCVEVASARMTESGRENFCSASAGPRLNPPASEKVIGSRPPSSRVLLTSS